MDTEQNPKPNAPTPSNTIPIRIHKSTARTLKSILNKANKKTLGKRVKADQVITKALELLTDAHLEEIKETTYDSKDKLEIEYRKYCQQNGSISKDEFLKKLLSVAMPQVASAPVERAGE